MKSISILLLIALGLQACGPKCPPDENIGKVELYQESLSYFPYQSKDTLVFRSVNGNILIFYQPEGIHQAQNKIAVKKICSEFRFDGKTTYQYYEGIGKTVWFKSDKGYSINITLLPYNLASNRNFIYDKLIAGVMQTGSIGRLELVTKKRFSTDAALKDFNITAPAHYLDHIQLGPKIFYKVWASDDFDGRVIYYNQSQGLVGFKTGRHTFYLEKIKHISTK